MYLLAHLIGCSAMKAAKRLLTSHVVTQVTLQFGPRQPLTKENSSLQYAWMLLKVVGEFSFGFLILETNKRHKYLF